MYIYIYHEYLIIHVNIRSDRTQGMEELGEARHAGAIFGGHGSIEMPTPSWINHD